MPKVTMLRNLAPVFYRENQRGADLEANDNKPHVAGETYDVSKEFAELVLKKGLAEVPELLRAVPSPAAIRGVPAHDDDESDVAGMTVPEATDAISRFRSKDKLQHVINTDTRAGVKTAAEKRLAELNK